MLRGFGLDFQRIGLGGQEHTRRRWFVRFVGAMLTLWFAGCSTPKNPVTAVGAFDPQTLQPGDQIKVSFPGAPALEAAPQTVRRDGKINIYPAGEVMAANKTPAQLEKELLALVGPQIQSQQVTVTVVSSSYSVFVSGAVLKPGKITPDRTVTALEAIMEAGGFDQEKANMKKVRVIRHEDGQLKHSVLNLKDVFEGKKSDPFYLKSGDILHVPEKFVWF